MSKETDWILDPRLASVPWHMRQDAYRAILNKASGFTVCDNCEGTGNQLLSMYQECEKCSGYGNLEKKEAWHDQNGLDRAVSKSG